MARGGHAMRSPENDSAYPLDGMTDEEIAARLTHEEGHRVTVPEVRLLIGKALLKLRRIITERGFKPDDF
ncbi:MAG: hypothetical protein BroJett006_09440 [Betaproteobacteria bacterium]|nr:MAG: hypothetical protein BroJett006_09440 [Betaproteobacteria bacterium]